MALIGNLLKQARLNQHLTQKELADKIGVKNNSISNWEKNQNKPDVDTIELLCGALKINPCLLFDGVDDFSLSKQEVSLTADVKELIECYQVCDKDNKEELLLLARLKATKSTTAACQTQSA